MKGRTKRQSRRPKRYLYEDSDREELIDVPVAASVPVVHADALQGVVAEMREQTRLWKRMIRVAEELEASVTEMSETLKDVRDLMEDSSSEAENDEAKREPPRPAETVLH